MDSLLWFILWAGLIVLMMRFGCRAHVTGHGHAGHGGHGEDSPPAPGRLRWEPPATDIDPVCGKTVETDKAKSAVHDGTVYYFCSSTCRDRFEAAPQLYVGSHANRGPQQAEHVHG